MKDGKGRQIIRTDKKGIEERKMNNDVAPQQKGKNPLRGDASRRDSSLFQLINEKQLPQKRANIMPIIRPNTYPDMDNKPRSMALKDSSSRTKAVDTGRQKELRDTRRSSANVTSCQKPRRKTLKLDD